MKRSFIIFLLGALAAISGYSQSAETKDPGNSTTSADEAVDLMPVLTPAKFAQIKTGLTKDEVRQILENDGEELSTSKERGQTYNVVKWTDVDYNKVIITFKNGRVMSVSKSALKRAVLPRLTPKKAAQIRIGLTKNSVRQILEGPGEEVSTNTGGGQTYNVVKWVDSKYNYIILIFKNGSVMSVSSSFK